MYFDNSLMYGLNTPDFSGDVGMATLNSTLGEPMMYDDIMYPSYLGPEITASFVRPLHDDVFQSRNKQEVKSMSKFKKIAIGIGSFIGGAIILQKFSGALKFLNGLFKKTP
ncbi:hypothetical protein IJ579_03530 [bacterium]|nr:hypothetical protein [bacterium]